MVKKKLHSFDFLHSYERRKTYLDNDLSYFHGFKVYVTLMFTIYQRATPSKACENKHWWIFQIKQQSEIQKCIARIMSKVSHEHWSDKGEAGALLFHQLRYL